MLFDICSINLSLMPSNRIKSHHQRRLAASPPSSVPHYTCTSCFVAFTRFLKFATLLHTPLQQSAPVCLITRAIKGCGQRSHYIATSTPSPHTDRFCVACGLLHVLALNSNNINNNNTVKCHPWGTAGAMIVT